VSRPSIDAATLIAAWQRDGHLAPEAAPAITAAIADVHRNAEPPIYLKILSAIGTFLATCFFLAFLGVSGLIPFDKGAALIVWGIVFLGSGIAMSLRLPGRPVGLGHDFLAQAAFAAMAVGKVLVVGGAIEQFGVGTAWIPTLALLVVTAATYPVSGSSLDRLLSPYATFCAALVQILDFDRYETGAGVGLTVYFAVALAMAGALLLSHRVSPTLRPIGLAALGAVGTVVCFLASGHDFAIWSTRSSIDPRVMEAMLALSLFGLVAWIAGGLPRLATPPLAAAALGILALGAAGAPGIVFALGLLALGHARHDTPMRVVGILALPIFLVLWYYGRNATFLEKSAMLVGSGALLLAARGVMAALGWDREETR
jgi:hypothetical protein